MKVGSHSWLSAVSSNSTSCRVPRPAFRNCGALVFTPNFFSSVRRKSASASCASVYSGANFWIAWQIVRRWNGLARSSSRPW
ncbi:hypothetical protein D3C85_1335720 [compost metagenome]